jgi:predicted small lipoprotein YifL
MTRVLAAALTLALGACGVDGPPSPPPDPSAEPERARTGITISGTAEIGVTGSLD